MSLLFGWPIRQELRSADTHRDNGYLLRAWASEIAELGCDSVQEIDTQSYKHGFTARRDT